MIPASPRWKRRPAGSNWGDFGPDDRLGRLNLITPARRRAAIAEAREGIAFCLSLPLDVGSGLSPRRKPPSLFAAQTDGQPVFNYPFCRQHAGLTDVICDDAVTLYTQYSTQWDSFSHVGSLFDADDDGEPEPRYYNGFPATAPGESPLGLDAMAATGVQGRGVMVDLHRHFGNARVAVGWEKLDSVMRADGLRVEEGDILCLHTGFAQRLLEMDRSLDLGVLRQTGAVLDGNDARLLDWIRDAGVVAIVADNHAVEARPLEPLPGYRGPLMPLHEHCLFKLGIPLGELWHLTPLARWLVEQRRHRFLLTAPPLRLPGAVGSPVSPVATV